MIENLLEQKKAAIIKKWFDLTINTYSADASQFIKKQQDPFANPVGSTISLSLAAVFDALLKGMDRKTIASSIDPIVRIRAVQNFSPAQAIGFVFYLKKIVRETLNKELKQTQIENELLLFESKIDELCMIAFDIYVECREKIYQLKVNTERNKIYSAFERAGLITEVPADRPDL